MDRGIRAGENFMAGYNCAQSVSMAFSDLVGMDEKAVARLASPFGGGMGRMREVCGAVSGMYLILGILYGYDSVDTDDHKSRLYSQVQELAAAFREKTGTILCREILENPPSDPNPSPRTQSYYAQRGACVYAVMTAARLLQQFIQDHPEG